MKLNIKGLAFVGFAAAILSASAARADDTKIVTSKSFTDATYQTKISGGEGYTGKVVTAGTVAGTPTYTEVDGTVTANSSHLVTSGAVAAAISGQGLGSTYEVLTNKLDDTTGKTIATNGTSTTLYPSAKAVKTYADSKVAQTITDGVETSAPSQDAVHDALASKANTADLATVATSGSYTDLINQPTTMTGANGTNAGTAGFVPAPAATDNVKFLQGDGTWAVPTNTTYTGSDGITLSGTNFTNSGVRSIETGGANDANGTISVNTNGTTAAVSVKGLASAAYVDTTTDNTLAATGETTKLPTAATVKSYVDSHTPAIAVPAGCTDAAPCALVADTTNGVHWVAMAQPSA